MAKKPKLMTVMARLAPLFLFLSFSHVWAQTTLGPLTFSAPNNFNCEVRDAQTICTDPREDTPKQSVIIATLKIRGDEDTMDNFKKEIGQSRPLQTETGTIASQVVRIGEKQIQSWPWIEAIHRDSEVKDYTTHYYVTVTAEFAVLFTFSIRTSEYQRMWPIFQGVVDSLRMNSSLSAEDALTVQPESAMEYADEAPKKSRSRNVLILAACGVLAILLLLYLGLKK